MVADGDGSASPGVSVAVGLVGRPTVELGEAITTDSLSKDAVLGAAQEVISPNNNKNTHKDGLFNGIPHEIQNVKVNR